MPHVNNLNFPENALTGLSKLLTIASSIRAASEHICIELSDINADTDLLTGILNITVQIVSRFNCNIGIQQFSMK